MKGSPLFPQCGFSSRAVAILDHLGATYESVDVLQDQEIRQGIKAYSDWPTIPQLYVKGEFVGGSDIMMEMYESGELATLFAGEQRRREARVFRRKPEPRVQARQRLFACMALGSCIRRSMAGRSLNRT